jgi:hypothetical protein
MTKAEKDVLFQFVDEQQDLRALLVVLLARTEHLADPTLFEATKKIAKQGHQTVFDAVRKQIEELA